MREHRYVQSVMASDAVRAAMLPRAHRHVWGYRLEQSLGPLIWTIRAQLHQMLNCLAYVSAARARTGYCESSHQDWNTGFGNVATLVSWLITCVVGIQPTPSEI